MANQDNYYREYKGLTKWLSLISSHFAQKKFFLHGTSSCTLDAHYICIVCAKYQRASVKALIQVDFFMYALPKHKHNLYLIGKNGRSQPYHFVKINILASNFFTQMFNVSILCKQSLRLFQQKLCSNLISPHMHYLCINKMQ